jgi:hypothetical protein
MKPDNKKFLKYALLSFFMAWLGYTLVSFFYHHYGLPALSHYVYGFIMHLPLWVAVLMFGGLVLKIKIPRRVTLVLELVLTILLFLPFVYQPALVWFDYFILPFYAVTYLLCLALLNKLTLRFNKP